MTHERLYSWKVPDLHERILLLMEQEDARFWDKNVENFSDSCDLVVNLWVYIKIPLKQKIVVIYALSIND